MSTNLKADSTVCSTPSNMKSGSINIVASSTFEKSEYITTILFLI